MSFNQTQETYGMYPVAYTASPAELTRWDDEGADHGVHGEDRTHLEMVHHALNSSEVAFRPEFTMPNHAAERAVGRVSVNPIVLK